MNTLVANFKSSILIKKHKNEHTHTLPGFPFLHFFAYSAWFESSNKCIVKKIDMHWGDKWKKEPTYFDWLRRIVACSWSTLRALSSRLNSMFAILRCSSSKAFPLLVTSSGPSMYIWKWNRRRKKLYIKMLFLCQKLHSHAEIPFKYHHPFF